MTTRSDEPDDEFWRRPSGPPGESPTSPHRAAPHDTSAGHPTTAAERPTAQPGHPTPPPYPGPPPTAAPPPGWRPPVHVQPPPPRQLPPQDLSRLDADERSARTLTYGVGIIAAAVFLVVICLVCSRFLF